MVFIAANIWISLQHPNDNVYRPDEDEFQNVTQHISVSMKDQHWDYFQLESRIPQINSAPHNNASPTPQDVRGDSGMDPSSSRAHGTDQKYIGKDCFCLSPQSYLVGWLVIEVEYLYSAYSKV